jgi:hypothetical protein
LHVIVADGSLFRGYPIDLPGFSRQDKVDYAELATYKDWGAYQGIPNWHPWKERSDAKDEEREEEEHFLRMRMTWERYCCWFFDLRRVFACVCAVLACGVHVVLFIW